MPPAISNAGLARWDIAVGGDHLYWTVLGRGAIWEANLDGSDPHAIVTGQAAPAGIAVNSGSIYWSTGRPSERFGDMIGQCPP